MDINKTHLKKTKFWAFFMLKILYLKILNYSEIYLLVTL